MMDERDRKRVDFARRVVCSDLTQDLIAIIDRLNKQLTEVKEAGEPFVAAYEYTTPTNSEIILWNYDSESLKRHKSCDLEAMEDANGRQVYGSDLCRLVQALDGISPSITKCQWKVDEDGIYWTECDGAWEFMAGNVSDNEMKYCPYCGSQIEEVNDE